MRPITEVLKLNDREELEKEWRERADLKARMVGRLYPSILQDEMIQIQRRIATLPKEF